MNDYIILYFCSLICLILIILCRNYSKSFGLKQIIFYILYNVVLYNLLFFKSNYGSGFLWWFYLMALTIIHIIVLLIYLIFFINHNIKK